jgi:hypothetical protein
VLPTRKFVVDDYIPIAIGQLALFVEVAGFTHGQILS